MKGLEKSVHVSATPRLILCVQSNRWSSLLVRNLAPGLNPIWALDIEGLIFEANKCRHAACVVELDSASPQLERQCLQLSQFANHSSLARLFVVGDCGLQPWRTVLRQCSVAGVCETALDIKPFANQITRQLERCSSDAVSIETWAQENLPWSEQRT